MKLFVFLILTISCSNKKSDYKIHEFDTILGAENVATINFLVSDFENDFLQKQYPDLITEDAYHQFLLHLSEGTTENLQSISKKAIERFYSSDLRLEMYEFPDSVWILENSSFDKVESDSLSFPYSPIPYIKSRYKYINSNGITEYYHSRESIGFIQIRQKLIQL